MRKGSRLLLEFTHFDLRLLFRFRRRRREKLVRHGGGALQGGIRQVGVALGHLRGVMRQQALQGIQIHLAVGCQPTREGVPQAVQGAEVFRQAGLFLDPLGHFLELPARPAVLAGKDIIAGPGDALQDGLRAQGFNLGNTESPVTPVFLSGEVPEATNLTFDLRENYNIFCSIVTYPVVPKGVILIRLIPTAVHTMEDVEYTIKAFSEIKHNLDSGKYATGEIVDVMS